MYRIAILALLLGCRDEAYMKQAMRPKPPLPPFTVCVFYGGGIYSGFDCWSVVAEKDQPK